MNDKELTQLAAEALKELYPNVNLPAKSHALKVIEGVIEKAREAEIKTYLPMVKQEIEAQASETKALQTKYHYICPQCGLTMRKET